MSSNDLQPLGRWGISLHEAGHLALAVLLLGDTSAAAVVLDNNHGCAYVPVGEIRLRNWREALVIAAGTNAEALRLTHLPPVICPAPIEDLLPPSTPMRSGGRPPSMYTEISGEIEGAISDEEKITHWALGAKGWARRWHLTQFNSWRLVQKHQAVIVDAARRLYLTGYCRASELDPSFLQGIPHVPR